MPATNLTWELDDGGNVTISSREYRHSVEPHVSRRQTIQESEAPAWVANAKARLEELVNLSPNWDSYGASPVSERIARITLGLLDGLMRDTTPLPSIIPTNAGRVQLEWHTKGIDLEVEVISPILLHASFEDRRTGNAWERDLNIDLTDLYDAVSIISAR
jgi:hypothetical protein